MFQKIRSKKPCIGLVLCSLLLIVCIFSLGQSRDMPVERLLQNLKTEKYSGKLIDLNLEDVNLKTVISHFEKLSGIPFELSPDIQAEYMVSWTYKCKQVPWDQVFAIILQEFNFEAIQKGEKVYLQTKTDTRMKLIREDQFKKPGSSWVMPMLIIIAVLAVMGGTAGFLWFKKTSKKKDGTSRDFSLDPEKAEHISKKVVYLFDVDKIYRNDDITLRLLSENMSIPPHQLSWVLNKKMNVTFSELVNSYRVEEVKKRLASSEDAYKTILDIAYEAGFSTKTSLNRVFLKLTGKTPSQYRKQNSPKKST
ncbi:MAG: helix-turn-helix domain-containing protein [Candidatus Aminicenantes bacterium]|nr:helix-turn-helix domain-containing protein [Candidatus Aminicenantes bacterium]